MWKNKSILPLDIGAASTSELNDLSSGFSADIASLLLVTDALESGTVKNELTDTIVVNNIRAISQLEYDALVQGPDANTFYIIL